jgi:hypothetical protein
MAQIWVALAKIVKHTNHHIRLSNSTEVHAESEVPLQIGYGFDSRIGTSKIRNCFKNAADPANMKYTNWSQKLNFEESISIQELSSLTNIDASIKGNYYIFSASAAARYTSESIDNRYSMNFNYAQSFAADAIYELPKGFGVDVLSDEAQQALKISPRQFVDYCGDTFVSSGKAGGVLLITVGISFRSNSDKTSFSTEIGGSITGIGSIAVAFSKASTKLNIDATMFVRGLQLGGNTTSLANIFGKPDTKGDYAIISCGKDNVDACNKIVDAIIDYAQNDFMSSFSTTKTDQLYNFASHLEKFSDIGVPIDNQELKPETIAAQQSAIDLYMEDRRSFEFLNAYMNSQLFQYWRQENIGYFKTVVEQYQLALSSYGENKILSSCFDSNPDDFCVSAVGKVKVYHDTIDSEKLVLRLRQVYFITTSEGLELTMVGTDQVAPLNPLSELDGNFLFYHMKANKFSLGNCWLDLFKNPTPNPYHDQSFYGKCANAKDDFIGANFYIKRTFLSTPDKIVGLCGWDDHEAPVYPDGGSCYALKKTTWNDMPI